MVWSQVLYGISAGDGEIVTVALSQVGNVGGQPYWSWYGFNSRVEWCACFVSWCANECGYIENGLSRSLQAAYKALSGLRKEDNGRTVALRQKQDTLSSSIGKVTVLQTMWVL